jgi:hypothetical protein
MQEMIWNSQGLCLLIQVSQKIHFVRYKVGFDYSTNFIFLFHFILCFLLCLLYIIRCTETDSEMDFLWDL